MRKRTRDRWKLRKLTESFRIYSHVVVIYFEADGNLSVSLAALAVKVWSAAYLSDMCLIAGTVIRNGGCALSSASPWLCCFEPCGTFDYLIFRHVDWIGCHSTCSAGHGPSTA